MTDNNNNNNNNVVSINGGKKDGTEQQGPTFDTLYIIEVTDRNGTKGNFSQVGYGNIVGDFFVIFNEEYVPQLMIPSVSIDLITTQQVERDGQA